MCLCEHFQNLFLTKIDFGVNKFMLECISFKNIKKIYSRKRLVQFKIDFGLKINFLTWDQTCEHLPKVMLYFNLILNYPK